jgi:hypothetical protein
MKLGIMQPYFFPYIGYFQLINVVDKFVLYDEIKYTKKGWINRNRILSNGKDYLFTLPIKNDSDYLDICDRKLANNFNIEAKKILNKIEASYRKAPYYEEIYPIISDCLLKKEDNLFNYIYYSIEKIKNYLDIKTELLIYSNLGIKNRLKEEERVIQICKHLEATYYINAIGGVELYNKEIFLKENIKLNFIKSDMIEYQQFDNAFIPWLSIIDVMMFNSKEDIIKMLNSYTLI